MIIGKYISKVYEVAYHRDGVGGNGFHVAHFTSTEGNDMVAVVFEEPGNVAVLDIDFLAQGRIAFTVNSWRGDNFEPELREAVKAYQEAR